MIQIGHRIWITEDRTFDHPVTAVYFDGKMIGAIQQISMSWLPDFDSKYCSLIVLENMRSHAFAIEMATHGFVVDLSDGMDNVTRIKFCHKTNKVIREKDGKTVPYISDSSNGQEQSDWSGEFYPMES